MISLTNGRSHNQSPKASSLLALTQTMIKHFLRSFFIHSQFIKIFQNVDSRQNKILQSTEKLRRNHAKIQAISFPGLLSCLVRTCQKTKKKALDEIRGCDKEITQVFPELPLSIIKHNFPVSFFSVRQPCPQGLTSW